jgi:hypothetical protein
MENRLIQKIPLNPPLPKGEDARKDSLRVVYPTSGNDKKTKINFIDTSQLVKGCLLRCAKGNEIIKIETKEIWRKSKSG